MRASHPFPIVVSGPSGTGKTTLISGLLKLDPLLKRSVSVTTRPPRDDEVEGVDYFFVDMLAFDVMKERELVEWAPVHDHFYGTPRRFVEEQLSKGFDVILNIDVQGGANMKRAFPQAVLVFILPPSFDALEARIRSRGSDDESEVLRRLENARRELEAASRYDYFIINDMLAEAVAQLRAVVEAERCRKERYAEDFIDHI